MKYELRVIGPIADPDINRMHAAIVAVKSMMREPAPKLATHEVHVFTLDTEAPIESVKAEADKLARRLLPSFEYTALGVSVA